MLPPLLVGVEEMESVLVLLLTSFVAMTVEFSSVLVTPPTVVLMEPPPVDLKCIFSQYFMEPSNKSTDCVGKLPLMEYMEGGCPCTLYIWIKTDCVPTFACTSWTPVAGFSETWYVHSIHVSSHQTTRTILLWPIVKVGILTLRKLLRYETQSCCLIN